MSPILWKAHVVDGNSRFAKHNIYKSDVFSVGLLFFQLAAMDDVTGFNQKSQEYDGEKLIAAGVQRLKARYSGRFSDVINHMLTFKEVDRPSFIELARMCVPQFSLPEPVTSPKGVPGELQPLALAMQRNTMSPTNAMLQSTGMGSGIVPPGDSNRTAGLQKGNSSDQVAQNNLKGANNTSPGRNNYN